MTRGASIAMALALLAGGCQQDRSAPLAEVEGRAAAREAAAAEAAAARAQRAVVVESTPTLEPAEVALSEQVAPQRVAKAADESAEVVTANAPLTYAGVAKVYNERIARLPRIWANAIVSATFKDEKGDSRWEQGNGHLQFQRPHFLALDIGKAGETMFWLGCDNDRFWVFDLQKERIAHVGTHEALTRERAAELGLPALPTEFPMLMGIAPLPTDANNATIRSINEGKAWRISLPPKGGVVTRLILDPKKVWPTRVEQLNTNGELLLESELAEYHQVKIAGEGGFFPQVSGRTRIFHHASGATMTITLDSPVDDRQIKPQNFDFASLKAALSIDREIDVDAEIRNGVERRQGD